MSGRGCVVERLLYWLTLHHPNSRKDPGLSDHVQSLVTDLRATCAPQGHFCSCPGGLRDLISEQAFLSNLLFLSVSRELKVHVAHLIFLS